MESPPPPISWSVEYSENIIHKHFENLIYLEEHLTLLIFSFLSQIFNMLLETSFEIVNNKLILEKTWIFSYNFLRCIASQFSKCFSFLPLFIRQKKHEQFIFIFQNFIFKRCITRDSLSLYFQYCKKLMNSLLFSHSKSSKSLITILFFKIWNFEFIHSSIHINQQFQDN